MLIAQPLIQDIDKLTEDDKTKLAHAESTIARGMKGFVEVGNALLYIREHRLYRETHGTFEDYCNDRWDINRDYANKLVGASRVMADLDTIVSKDRLPQRESQARELKRVAPEQRADVWQQAQEGSGKTQPTAREVRQAVEQHQEGSAFGVREVPASFLDEPVATSEPQEEEVEEVEEVAIDRDSWSTPSFVVATARLIMGGIDLDPASNEAAQEVVKATTFYTAEDDGLSKDWSGRVWLNPPYSQPLCKEFVEKLVSSIESGSVEAAVLLTNTASETRWWQHAAASCDLLIFPSKRLQFWHPDTESSDNNRFAQTLFVWGKPIHLFNARREMTRKGWLMMRPERNEQ